MNSLPLVRQTACCPPNAAAENQLRVIKALLRPRLRKGGVVLLALHGIFLLGCGGAASNSTISTPAPPSLATSSFSPSCSPCTVITAPLTTLKNGGNLPTLGYNAVCTLKAGNTLMNWTATPSGSWFTVTPSFGALQPNASTPIQLANFTGSAIPYGTKGLVTISASGYTDNTGMGLVYQQAGIANGVAVDSISVSCQ
jgi:hypothetical protein